jgi:Parathyroid hormone family
MFHRSRRAEQRAAPPAAAPGALRLTDRQLDVIHDVARQIPPRARSMFLQELAQHLRTVEIEDATVHRAAVAVRASVLARTSSAPWTAGRGGPEDG